ncbi:MAG: polyphosphate:nucleotide phosphotransferase, family [Acidimicrobiaceae bacterium]|jgi:PPK2 family polyphosphate:nucleotide phosphotransferase|nr:polyphosphate:nucleotide phosphotransferase, family [Acidimicrobiaceae bacterium]
MEQRLKFVYDLVGPLAVPPGKIVDLSRDCDPGNTDGLTTKQEASDRLAEGIAMLVDYQNRLAAQDAFGVLVVLQGLDAAGKDSTIKHVMSGLNPQGVAVHSFKQPSVEELSHDFLWRYQTSLPGRGRIGIYNRSHYEEVLVVRVHPELLASENVPVGAASENLWKRRYRAINDWEHYVVDNGIRIVKVFLNLSRTEQAKRFLARIDDPEKNWKFSESDIRERRFWDDYQHAFNQMLIHTSTQWAPWYVVPADRKWFARLATAAILARALVEIDPQYPRLGPDALQEMSKARSELLVELGR